MSLIEIEDQIRSCNALTYVTYGDPDIDENGNETTRQITGVRAAVEGLYGAWAILRRQLWSPPYRAWAEELKEECRKSLESLSREHNLVYFGEPDRWPATATAPAVH